MSNEMRAQVASLDAVVICRFLEDATKVVLVVGRPGAVENLSSDAVLSIQAVLWVTRHLAIYISSVKVRDPEVLNRITSWC